MHFNLMLWAVSVEDQFRLDGSWEEKPMPAGSRFKGTCRVRLAKNTLNELEICTEFPENNGSLRDTLTVAENGESFTRVVVRYDPPRLADGEIMVTRVFRRERDASR
eukprot:gnl/TRDRNA2_/TRDRNA2_159131_c1_seq2.p1 gnl/TRDRNA2_/TRDRNA2_159131_c1~~gnl/TRDRNA2_/TRDRNA2_159131_c1_seq2.p1  ORF type:complete len:107 (+),score=19.03 gnl/TRDRNA2_/TRDRNA2_159131_c1_seq2:45-365(+)